MCWRRLVLLGSHSTPRDALCTNERLHPFPAGQTPPELAAFALQTNAYVKERAAGVFQRREFRQRLVVRGVGNKFKLVPVRQLLDSKQGRAQCLAQFLLMLPLLGRKRRAIAKEWTVWFVG